jgi:hypothetical protein
MIHYTPDQLASFPWIVSSATLRPEDLLPSYWSAVESLAQLTGKASPIAADTLADLERLVGEDSSEDAWNYELACQLLEELTDCLQELAPCGFGFGASEGDGACFGFWLSEDWQDAMEHLQVDCDDPTDCAALVSELELDGIDPDNVEDSYQGRAEGYSEERAGTDYAQQLAQDSWLPEGPGGIGWNRWPVSCIDWEDAWQELRLGDGYRLHDLGGGEWLVFRSV